MAATTRSATRIAGAFLRAAMGPVEYAGSCIVANKIETGLVELGPEGLSDAYRRGIADVARLVGVTSSEVEAILPAQEVGSALDRLRSSHPRALQAWRSHAGPFGFLDVVTALTVDGRRPEIGIALERVAGKVRHDRELSAPLEALAVDITAWEDLVVRSRHILEDRGWLAAALRRRVIKRTAFGLFALTLLISITASIVWVRIQKDRVRALVERTSPCEAENIQSAELSWASQEQKDLLGQKAETCKQEREAARVAAEREAEQRAQLEREQARVAAQKRACEDLASAVEKGELGEPEKATAGAAAALWQRVAKKALADADAGPTDPTFPCADDAAVKKRLEAAFTSALLIDPLLWARRADPSPHVIGVLTARKAELPDKGLIGLADNAERSAKAGLSRGDKAQIATARRRCALATALGVAGHAGCNGLASVPP